MQSTSSSPSARITPQAVLAAVAGATVLVCCAAAFTGLGSASLWGDEIFSAYFADRTMPDLPTALTRASEDVNPPGYYLLLWGVWRTLGGEFEITARALSAAMGSLAVLLVALAPLRGMPLAPRLVGAAFAVGSSTWFLATQEARSYAVALVLVTTMAALALRCVPALRAGRVPGAMLAALSLASCAAVFVHYYALTVAGALFTVLLPFARSRRTLPAVVLAGLLTLGFAVALVAWHHPRIVPDITATWFRADARFLTGITRQGVVILFGGTVLLFATILGACVAWGAATSARATSDAASQGARTIALLSAAAVVAYGYAVAITLAFTPMLGHRFFYLLAPLVWISVSHAAWIALSAARGAAAVAVALAVATPLLGWSVLHRTEDAKEPWRHAAAAVTEMEGCVGAALPVLWMEQPYFSEDDPERFHGFYMPPHPGRTWIPVARDALPERLAQDDIAGLVRETASGARRCPVLLWAASGWQGDWGTDIPATLEAHLPEGSGARLSVETVAPRDGGLVALLVVLRGAGERP